MKINNFSKILIFISVYIGFCTNKTYGTLNSTPEILNHQDKGHITPTGKITEGALDSLTPTEDFYVFPYSRKDALAPSEQPLAASIQPAQYLRKAMEQELKEMGGKRSKPYFARKELMPCYILPSTILNFKEIEQVIEDLNYEHTFLSQELEDHYGSFTSKMCKIIFSEECQSKEIHWAVSTHRSILHNLASNYIFLTPRETSSMPCHQSVYDFFKQHYAVISKSLKAIYRQQYYLRIRDLDSLSQLQEQLKKHSPGQNDRTYLIVRKNDLDAPILLNGLNDFFIHYPEVSLLLCVNRQIDHLQNNQLSQDWTFNFQRSELPRSLRHLILCNLSQKFHEFGEDFLRESQLESLKMLGFYIKLIGRNFLRDSKIHKFDACGLDGVVVPGENFLLGTRYFEAFNILPDTPRYRKAEQLLKG